MGLLDSLMGRGKEQQVVEQGAPPMGDPYGMYQQGIDPGMMQLLQGQGGQGNAQIAQFAIDNDEIIETIKSELQGFRIEKTFDIDTKKDVVDKVKFGEPIMNDKGINETCRILRMFLSKPFLLSNFPKEDRVRIDRMMIILWRKLAGKYAVMAEEYGLDRSRRSDLAFSITMMVYMNVMRSYEDGERPRMYGSHKTVQSIQQNTSGFVQPQQKKFMGIFG